MVLHSIADGVALGSSIFISAINSSSEKLGTVIFFAILMHKTPAALGFGTFLFHEGKQGWNLLKFIIGFTASSPLAAYLTFLVL